MVQPICVIRLNPKPSDQARFGIKEASLRADEDLNTTLTSGNGINGYQDARNFGHYSAS